jgi:hypothetical protein
MEVEVLDQQTLDAPAQDPRVLGGAAATVPGPNRDTEVALINQTMWQVVHERSKSGATVSAIARELDIDRKTVRRCLQQHQWKPYARNAKSPAVMDEFADWLKQRAPQVHYSARILLKNYASWALWAVTRPSSWLYGRCVPRPPWMA